MVLKSKVGLYQLHKENKNVQNKEIFPILFSSTNAFLVYFYFIQSVVSEIFFTIKILADA